MKPLVMRTSSDKSSAHFALGAALLLSAACGSQSKDQQSAACAANPPAYIDIDICSRLVDDQTAARMTECDTCCENGGFSDYSFACNRHCSCGESPSVSDSVTCAAEVANGSGACSTCCTNSGYNQSNFSSAACNCVGLRNDDQICAATLDLPDPGQACPNCCLDNGYLNVNYFSLTRQCTCSG